MRPEGPLLDSPQMPDSDENGRPTAVRRPARRSRSPTSAPLDPEIEARRRAALALVRTFGDPVLRSSAVEVTRFDDSLREEVARMGHMMDDAIGLGLAATQLGVMHRLLVYRPGPTRRWWRSSIPRSSGPPRSRRPPRRAA